MKKLRLIGVHSQKEELLRELMLLGCVEVSDPAGRPDRKGLAEALGTDNNRQRAAAAGQARPCQKGSAYAEAGGRMRQAARRERFGR